MFELQNSPLPINDRTVRRTDNAIEWTVMTEKGQQVTITWPTKAEDGKAKQVGRLIGGIVRPRSASASADIVIGTIDAQGEIEQRVKGALGDNKGLPKDTAEAHSFLARLGQIPNGNVLFKNDGTMEIRSGGKVVVTAKATPESLGSTANVLDGETLKEFNKSRDTRAANISALRKAIPYEATPAPASTVIKPPNPLTDVKGVFTDRGAIYKVDPDNLASTIAGNFKVTDPNQLDALKIATKKYADAVESLGKETGVQRVVENGVVQFKEFDGAKTGKALASIDSANILAESKGGFAGAMKALADVTTKLEAATVDAKKKNTPL